MVVERGRWGPEGVRVHIYGKWLALNIHASLDRVLWEWRLCWFRTTRYRKPHGINLSAGPLHVTLIASFLRRP